MQPVTALRPEIALVGDDQIVEVYRYVVAHGGIDSIAQAADELRMAPHVVHAAVDQLVGNRLLRRELGGFELVDPEVAVAALVSPVEREIYQRREQIAQIRARIEAFRKDYTDSARPATKPPVDHVVGAVEVRGYLKLAGDTCEQEALVLQSGQLDGDDLDCLYGVCADLLAGGVAVRIACPHRSRADLTARMRLKGLIEAGAAVRTVSHLPRAAVVFDGRLAVLLGGCDDPSVASRVQDGEVVRFLLDVFDHVWDGATPLEGFETGYADVADDLIQAIAGLMAQGHTDEAVARKLGMSVRTTRRHIATLMRDLDAVSRFQAGVQAARRNLAHSG